MKHHDDHTTTPPSDENSLFEADMGRIAGIIVGVALIGAAGCTLLGVRPLEDSIVFQPRPYPSGDWKLEPGIEDAWFASEDGVKLHGWFAEAAHPRAVTLYAHGNAGNVTDRRSVLQLFRDRLNVSVLVFDYKGYGQSEGTPCEEGILADARAARHWLAVRAKVREQEIVLVGHSLGGGVAVDLAAKDGARGLILENTFSSLPDVAASHFPLAPVRLLMSTRFDSLAKIRRYSGPLLQTHGEADQVVPFASGRKLFDAARSYGHEIGDL